MKKWLSTKRREGGAALLTVLLMLAAMSAIAVGITDDIRFDIKRAVNIRMQDQAFWFGLGGEEFARQAIRDSDRLTPGRNTLMAPWAQGPVRLPLDNGLLEAAVTDGGNCFNLNSVVEEEDGVYTLRELGVAQYINLLEALGFDDGQRSTLAYSLADWIDSDSVPGPRGAEDYHYTGMTPSYRTGAVFLADVSELRAINGYAEPLYQRLRPFVCALPSDVLSPINVNTLREQDAPLLTMLVGQDLLAVDGARAVIGRRPYDGYPSLDAFWADEAFEGYEPDDDVSEQIGAQTRVFDVRMQITLGDAFFAMNSVFERRAQGLVLVSRSIGLPE